MYMCMYLLYIEIWSIKVHTLAVWPVRCTHVLRFDGVSRAPSQTKYPLGLFFKRRTFLSDVRCLPRSDMTYMNVAENDVNLTKSK